MDSGIAKDSSNGISPLGISVAELAGGFNHIALDCGRSSVIFQYLTTDSSSSPSCHACRDAGVFF
jgi:hypothetical protein